jgi:hypothetical protein
MSPEMIVTTDGHGPKVVVDERYERFGRFLLDDVQGNAGWTRTLLGLVDDLRAGLRQRWTGDGNAWDLQLSPSTARIDNLYTEEDDEIPLADFRDLLEQWLRHVEHGSRS